MQSTFALGLILLLAAPARNTAKLLAPGHSQAQELSTLYDSTHDIFSRYHNTYLTTVHFRSSLPHTSDRVRVGDRVLSTWIDRWINEWMDGWPVSEEVGR